MIRLPQLRNELVENCNGKYLEDIGILHIFAS